MDEKLIIVIKFQVRVLNRESDRKNNYRISPQNVHKTIYNLEEQSLTIGRVRLQLDEYRLQTVSKKYETKRSTVHPFGIASSRTLSYM